MICPKCKKTIEDNVTICPHCKKVLALVCPICGVHNTDPTCSNCNFLIVSKCVECGAVNPTSSKYCLKCKTSTMLSAARKFTNNENTTAITVSLENLKRLGKCLGEKRLLTKFLFKLKSLIFNYAKELGAYPVMINESTFLINITEDLTEYSAAQKAVKSSIKLLNILCNLNRTLKKELMLTLEFKITVEQKKLEEFFVIPENFDKIKLLDLYSEQTSDVKGLQLVTDEYIYRLLKKDYPLESLYSNERNGEVISYYSLNISNYIVPPKTDDVAPDSMQAVKVKVATKKETDYEQELYKKSIEGIKVSCKFEQLGADALLEFLESMNFTSGNRIISLRGDSSRQLPTKTVFDILNKEVPCYTIVCSSELSVTPWGFFRTLLSMIESSIVNNLDSNISKLLYNLKNLTPVNFESAEEARLTYIEAFLELLIAMPRSVIYIENFHDIDSASLHVLEQLFLMINKTNLSFVVTNSKEFALQKHIPDLLNSYYYSEIYIGLMDTQSVINKIIQSDDFNESFYNKKIIDNAGASYLYCSQAINYLIDCGIILDFNGKSVLTDSKTVILPFGLESLINTRLKRISKDASKSLVLAYSYILGPIINFSTLEKLGLNNLDVLKSLQDSGFVLIKNDNLFIQNYDVLKNSFKLTLKPEVLKYLATNLVSKVFTGDSRDYSLALSLDYLGNYSLEFSKLYELSIVSLQFGDYDTYLKICIKLLHLLNVLEKEIPQEELLEYQTDFYNNLTQLLYRYAPESIYPMAELLLQKALKANDDEKIRTLSNMLLQGGLLTSNYTNTFALIQNIMERTEHCSLKQVDGSISSRVFALYLVSLEVYFNLGFYDKCIQICHDILSVVSPDMLESIKPSSFSLEQYQLHLADSFIYYLLSSLFVGNDLLLSAYQNLGNKLQVLPEGMSAIIDFYKYLKGEDVSFIVSDEADLFSVLFGAIHSFEGDYSIFAGEIYKFKKLASQQSKLMYVMLADLLIAYSYRAMNVFGKAEHIYNSVYSKAKHLSHYFVLHLANFFLADLAIAQKDYQTALQKITNSITVLERAESSSIFLLYLLKKQLINISKVPEFSKIDTFAEQGFVEQMEVKYPNLKNIFAL